MKKLIYLLPLALFACSQPKATEEAEKEPVVEEPQLEVVAVKRDARTIGPAKSAEQLLIEEAIEKMNANAGDLAVGYWVGMFGKNKINIAIADIKDGKALGYTVCAGNYRPITGIVTKENTIYKAVINEPGSDQYDGHFEFTIDTETGVLSGSWSPFKKGVVGSKNYTLTKMAYAYTPESGKYPEASTRLLTENDVANLLPEELEYMRNEIYARHGYSFKDLEDRRVFDVVEWYIPMGIDIRDNLTDIEVQNIDLIYRYEEYYNESYDDYGR